MPGLDFQTLEALQKAGAITPETLALAQPVPIADPIEVPEVIPGSEGSFDTTPLPDNVLPEQVMPEVPGDIPLAEQPELALADPIEVPVEQPQEFIPPDTTERYGNEIAALEAQKSLIPEQQEIDTLEAGINQDAAEQKFNLSTEREQKLMDLLDDRDRDINTAVQDMKKEFDTFKNMKINDFWADKSSGSKILAALAIGLGGFSGGTNQAAAIINKTVDQDFKRQKAAIDKQFNTYKVTAENVDDLRDLYKDRIKTLNLMHIVSLDKIKEELELKASKIGTKKAALNARVLGSKIDLKKAKALDKGFRESQDAINRRLLVSKKRSGLTPYQEWRKERDLEERNVVGYGPARTVSEAKKIRDQAQIVDKVTGSLDHIISLGDGITKLDRKQLAVLQTRLQLLVGDLRIPVTGPGILTEKEREMLLNEVIGDPSRFFSTEGIQKAKLVTLKKVIKQGLDNMARQVIIGYGGNKKGASPTQNKQRSLKELTPEDQASFRWAKENLKTDPVKAKRMLEFLQKKYGG